MHHHKNIELAELPRHMPTEEDEAAMRYIETSNPNASYDPQFKYNSFDNRVRVPKKRTGAHFNPVRIDPRRFKEPDLPPAGVNTNYGLGGGHASYIAQGSGTGTLNVHQPRLSAVQNYQLPSLIDIHP